MRGILLVLALALSAVAEEPPVRGRLCVSDREERLQLATCRETQGLRIDVPAAPGARRFAWLRSDGRALVVGRIDPEIATIDLDAKAGSVRAQVEGSSQRGWPAELRLDISAKSETWSLALPAASAAKLREIRVPQGTYDFRFEADHHLPRTRAKVPVGKDGYDLEVVTLEPRPRLTASIRGEDGAILAGAAVVDSHGKLLATADHLGQVLYEADCERPCTLPSQLVVNYPGLAGTRILVTSPKSDFDAGTVVLGAGGALDVVVRRPEGQQFPIRVEVTEALANDPRAPRVIAKETLAADMDRIRIEKLPTGKAGLYLRGDSPMQVVSTYVTIEREKVAEQRLDIRPTDITVRVLKGSAPVAGATIQVGVPHGQPDYDVSIGATDAEGRVRATVWQTEVMVATANVNDRTATEFFQPGEKSTEEVRIVISPTMLRGRVYDAERGEPLTAGSVQYQWVGSDGKSFTSAELDAQGRYEVPNVRAGKHTVVLQEPGFLPAEATIESNGTEEERILDLPLSRGIQHKVMLRWSDGTPVVSAAAIQVIESGRRYQRWSSDPAGTFLVPVARGTSPEIWIVPREGAFNAAVLDSTRDESTVTLTRPQGTLIVRTVDASGNAMPSSHLAMSYEGRPVDRWVLGTLRSLQGLVFKSGSDGVATLRGMPAGAYEFWAVQYEGDDLSVGRPGKDQKITRVYYPGGDLTVTVEPSVFRQRPR